ncbi:hypothetical protein DFJ77DRAFT_429368 [Powellomyces hirtus]|nr:hypothetical protein DFJ77DRAFT_429368 [Powellomyces hirtus]
MHLGGLIRNKVDWFKKVNDETIVAKWRKEISEAFGPENSAHNQETQAEAAEEPDFDLRTDFDEPPLESPEDLIRAFFSERLLDYVIAECRELGNHHAVLGAKHGIVASAVEGTYHADRCGDEPFLHQQVEDLLECLKDLENIPDNRKDWHPNTNKQVLDLVHPSLFCLEQGRTRKLDFSSTSGNSEDLEDCLKHIGSGTVIPQRQDDSSAWRRSRNDPFQWLPAEFAFTEEDIKIKSYINNLHPVKHKRTYEVLESMFDSVILLLQEVLQDLANRPHQPPRITVGEWYADEEEEEEEEEEEDKDEDEDDDARWERSERRPVIQPEIPTEPRKSGGPHVIKLAGTTNLQVIVKLASIHLTPENAAYPGGSWHLEGTEDESIIATAIHYLSIDNITPSRLSFRQVCDDEFPSSYEQDDRRGVEAIYGLVDNRSRNQVVGSIDAIQGRCVAFPNCYQHRVEPFQLADPTKPGHRKILCFFLVNPKKRITSTRDVPPQQFSWWFIQVFSDPCSRLSRLPLELREAIAKHVHEPMRMTEAKDQRARLMECRKANFTGRNRHFMRTVSLCEH